MPDRVRLTSGGTPSTGFLRVPLFYKILIANALIVVLGAIVGTTLTRHAMRASGGTSTFGVEIYVAVGGVILTVLVNALIVRLALTPLQLLEATAAKVQEGDLDARVPDSPLTDREMQRLAGTFNSMLDNLEVYRQRLRDMAARALRAEEEERKRISRELHDDTAQTLAALLLRTRLLLRGAPDDARRAELEEFRTQIAEALERVRRFARGLRPPALDELGLVPALEWHARSLSEATGTPIRVEAEPLDGALTPQGELVLYRIAQEALSNAVRHSGADRVELRLAREDDDVALTVSDDGRGFDPARVDEANGRGLGLFGMEERAAYLGGRVTVESAPGEGTLVRAVLPAVLNANAPTT